jgi:hypothetical protein
VGLPLRQRRDDLDWHGHVVIVLTSRIVTRAQLRLAYLLLKWRALSLTLTPVAFHIIVLLVVVGGAYCGFPISQGQEQEFRFGVGGGRV